METKKKVNYPDYKDKYDEEIKSKMETSPESVDVEMMRENLYGYTYTKGYAKGEIPNELSMDYWEEQYLNNSLDENGEVDVMSIINRHTEQSIQDIYWYLSPQESLIMQAIDSTGDGKTPETAFCVIDVHQEYEFINRSSRFLGFQLVKQSVANGIDCLEFENYKGDIEKAYFNISRRFEVGY